MAPPIGGKRMTKWIIGAGAALLLAVHLFTRQAMTALLTRYAAELTPIELFLDALAIPKIAMILCVLALNFGAMLVLAGLIMALIRQTASARIIAWILAGGGVAGTILGALGGLYSHQVTRQGMAATGISDPMVLAPSNAETLLTLSIGAFTGAVMLAAALLVLLVAQWRAPKAATAA